MTDLNVALVGCGRISGHHALSIAETDGIRLAAVCDLECDRADVYAEAQNVPAFDNYHRMLEEMPEIDIVSVNTPSGMHHEHALHMIRKYGKHVVVEKPTFMRPSQLDSALEAAAAAGVRIFPVFQNRYNKAVARVRKALQSGELGELRTVSVRLRWCRPQRYYDLAPWRGTFSHDGGALTNQTIHHVDLLRHLGGPVKRVNATMRTMGAEIEVEDTTAACFEYVSGALGTLESTTAARPDDFEASISLVCSEGLAQIGGIAVNELQIFTPDPDACGPNSEDFVGIEGHGAVYGYGHGAMYADIVAAMRGERPYPVDADDCRNTLGLLHAFYRSDEAGSWVNIEEGAESTRLGRENEAISQIYRTPE
ncbi:MAG: dehydrogenase [Rhodospirillaceae bacterium]|nr:dehydrogenase [Rhodospirillaceae bacterium]